MGRLATRRWRWAAQEARQEEREEGGAKGRRLKQHARNFQSLSCPSSFLSCFKSSYRSQTRREALLKPPYITFFGYGSVLPSSHHALFLGTDLLTLCQRIFFQNQLITMLCHNLQ